MGNGRKKPGCSHANTGSGVIGSVSCKCQTGSVGNCRLLIIGNRNSMHCWNLPELRMGDNSSRTYWKV